jgi:hypothetical protein
VTGLSIGMGTCWFCLVTAEMIAGQFGIGYYTWESYTVQRFPEIVVGMLAIGALGMGSSALSPRRGGALMPWYRPQRGGAMSRWAIHPPPAPQWWRDPSPSTVDIEAREPRRTLLLRSAARRGRSTSRPARFV